ncbi:InlB B-repeat-containing protein [Desulfosporosinus meridiei]|nr:InlB B-repeat-containing protein [Desulfosporosinus meridiei]
MFKKSISLLIVLVFVFALLPLGSKQALAATKDFRTIVPDQQWFFFPNSVAADDSGNFYVADTSSHRILKYDPSGVLLENWGPYGTGAGKFYSPAGVAVDGAGNVYVADTSNHRIQKRNAGTGVWTTWGSSGSGNKQFSSPSGVAVDADGNVYVADTFNSRIQKFDSNGNYLTQWGSLGSDEGQLKYPFDLAVSSNGTVYVADQNNSRIQMFSTSGTPQGMWGEKGSGEGQFNIPASIDIDSNGDVYVLDSANSRVQKFQPDGSFLQQWGSGGLSDGQFFSPRGIAVSSSGSVFVADTQNKRIQKFTSSGTFLAKWGSYGNNDGELYAPVGLAVDGDGKIYVGDSNTRISKFNSAGAFEMKWGSSGYGDEQFSSIRNVAVDSNGNLYISNLGTNSIKKYDPTGGYLGTPIRGGTNNVAQLWNPMGIAFDHNGNMYVCSSSKYLVLKFDSNYNLVRSWGSQGSGNGQFDNMNGIGVDSSGNVYVADTNNSRIQKFTSEGGYLTQWGSAGSTDGKFYSPRGIAVDSQDNVYVGDGNRVQKFSSAGVFQATWGSSGNGDGQFSGIYSLAVDRNDNIYVADSQNHRIQRLTNLYTVTFDSNEGSPVAAISNVTANATVTLPEDPEKEGYTFAGWYTDNGDFENEFTGSTPVTGDLTVYAKWTELSPNTYTVSFDSNEGSPVAAISNVTANATVTLPEDPEKEGYTFAGWYTDNGDFENEFTGSTPVTGDLTVYAKWTELSPNTYTVSFDSNEGSPVAAISNVTANATVTLPEAPDKEGYTFAGWYTDNETFENEFTGSTPVTGDLTVYAKWTELPPNTYRVTFDSNEGSPVAAISNVTANTTVTLPEAPDKEGYTFAGWYTDNGTFENEFTGSTPVTGDLTVYAKWTLLQPNTYRVTFDSNEGSPVAAISNVTANATVTLPEDPEKEGYTFAGWYTDNGDFENEFTGSTPVTGDLTVYAKWTELSPNTYTVSFDSNEGSPVAAISNVTANATVTLPEAPEKEGYTFAGWYTDNGDFENEFTGSTPVTGDLTVYAKWTELPPNTYRVTFDSNEGSPVAAISNVTANTTVTLPEAPDKEGYTFAGWYTDNGTFENEFTGSTPVTGDLTVYAKWTELPPNTYRVTFDSNEGSPVAAISNVTANTTVTLPEAPDKEGYTFAGWYTDNGTFENEFTGSTPVTGDLTVYAKWTLLQPNTYRVTFDSNEGSPVAAISNVTANATVTLPEAPDKEGYTFAGWYTDNETFENEFTGSTPVTGDLTVYAKWTELPPNTYRVTFDSNEGSPVAAISNVTANATVTLPEAPEKEGYTFAGWYTDNGDFENEFTGSTPVTGDLTVYAKWTELSPNTYTVSFDSNEGSPVAAISNVTANATVTLPEDPEKEGYTFAGWYTDNGDFENEFTGSTPVTGNVTVYAKWTRNSPGGNNGSGGGSNSSKPPTTPSATVTGDVKNGTTGSTVANITAAVTKDSKNRLTLTMPAGQLVVAKQPDGKVTPLIDDVSKVSITGEDGTAFTVSAKGTLQVSGLAQGTDHTYTISYDFGKGQKINLGTLAVKIDKKGNVTKLNVTLIDPYGILTDGTTGKVIAGAQVTLYYADTARNKAAGKTPGALVELPVLKDFEPNNNKNPQISDENGAYGFMVYPTTDYYLVAGKEGYEEYKSPTISVEQDLVKWDIQMMKASTGVNRLAGLNQVDTALAIAQATFPGKLNRVVLATGDNYPDALAGSVLAYQLNAPILLVGSQEADQEKVMEYLNNSLNQTGEVYILGGTAVVSGDMEAKIQARGFSRITRLAGIDRYETALKIAEHLGVKTGTPVILAYGESYPDALSVSSIAARMESPIFLVPQDGLSSDLKEAIARIMPSKVYIIGGTAVVSSAVEAQTAQLTSLDKTKIVRIGGQDAYETSLAVANYFNESGSSLCLATGDNFPDALTGSVYAAKHNAPILLVGSSLSNSFIEYIKTRKLRGMTLFGGTAVVNTGIEEQLRSLLEK